MISLNTNVNDLILQRTLYEGTFGLNYAIERMTTGYKVNHAKDNAAGYSIIEDLNTRISSMIQIQNNTEDGISLLSTAQGGLEEIETLLSRLRELTIQASNGTYDAQSREAMQIEADAIVAEIERLKNIIEFNGMKLYERPRDNAVASISNATQINSIHSMMFTPQESNSSDLTTYLLSDEENPTSSDTFSLNQPITNQIESTNSVMQSRAAPMMYSASPASAENIEGAENFSASETRTITIDGVQYTVKNRQSTASTLSYIKDGTSGQVTFLGAYFDITAQSDVVHNICINGNYIYFYGGNEADTITTTDNSTYTYIYGQGGNDTLIGNGYGDNLHGGDGDDNIIDASTDNRNNTFLYGDGGEDTITINGSGISGVYGGADNDTIHVYGDSNGLKGDDGDDKFYIYSGANNNTINGGSGTNTVELDQGTNTTKVNVVGANAFSEEFSAKNETKTITINNIDYTVTNNNSSAATFMWEVAADGQIMFKGSSFTIRGDENAAHNVKLTSSYQDFHGGNLNDKVEIISNAMNIYTYGGDDEIISSSASRQCLYIDTGDGDDKITGNRIICSTFLTGSGDDEIKLHSTNKSYSNFIDLGSDNDVLNGYITNSAVVGGNGTNTFSGTQGNTLFIDFNDSINNGTVVLFNGNETKDVVINGKTYTIQNRNSEELNLVYSYNEVTGFIDFGGHYFTITAQSDVEHKVNLYGIRMRFYGGELNDEIVNYSYAAHSFGQGGNDKITGYNSDSSISGGAGNDVLISESYVKIDGNDGDDTIIINNGTASSVINGGSGNDSYELNAKTTVNDTSGNNIFHVNANNTTINSGTGNDTFYINSSNNNITAGDGDDYFEIQGGTNNIDGGTGNNYYVDDTGTNNYTNVVTDPNSGKIQFSSIGEVITRVINNKTYTFTNKGSADNSMTYTVNTNIGLVTLVGSNVQVDGKSDEGHSLAIKGDNNIINGGDLADSITIASGSNNIVNGNSGNDVLRNESVNNSFFGGDDNDTIELLASTNLEVNGGSGNNTLNISSSNNTQINAGSGNNNINVSGNNNIIQTQNGNNNISISGTGNSLDSGSGNNKLSITNNNNTVNLGNGNNTYAVSGNGNNLTIQNAVGDVYIYGSNNTITQTKGSNDVSIKGDLNTYTSVMGQKDVDVIGNGNNITTGIENDTIRFKGNANTLESLGGNNAVEINGNSNQALTGDGVDSFDIRGNSNTALAGDGNDSFNLIGGDNNNIDGEAGDRNTMINFSTGTNYSNVIDITPLPFQLDIKVGIGSSENAVISTDISFNPVFLSVDLSSQESALVSLETIDETLKSVQNELLKIGSTINRLEYAIEEQNIKLENMISTRSTLRDADIAEESSNYIRYQILQEASATLIASSRNLRKENVLGLLQSLKR